MNTNSVVPADWGAGGVLHWLRDHNCTSGHPLRLAGIDLPEAGGALRPVLEPLAEYLRDADPDSLPLAETALRISDSFLAGLGSGAAAAPAWSQLDSAGQDALTASLARLQQRLHAIEPLAVDRRRQEIAERMIAAACTVDYMFRAMHGLIEAGLIDAGLGGSITLTDLRRAPRDERGKPLLTGIRTQSAATHTPLPDAFDAVISTPTVTRDPTVTF